jgi:hypothetical protein
MGSHRACVEGNSCALELRIYPLMTIHYLGSQDSDKLTLAGVDVNSFGHPTACVVFTAMLPNMDEQIAFHRLM